MYAESGLPGECALEKAGKWFILATLDWVGENVSATFGK